MNFLRVDADGLARGKAPQDKIDIVRGFHGGRRQLYAPADFLAEIASDVAADQRAARLADGAVVDRALHVGEFRIEALRIADGEDSFFERASAINSSASASSSDIGFSRKTCFPASRLSLAIG